MIIRNISCRATMVITAMIMGMNAMAQVKIGDNPTTLDNSAMLEISSTSKGLLLPRLTTAQMTAIVNPATALVVWCTNCTPAGLRVFDGTAWTSLYTASAPLSVVTGISCNGYGQTGNFLTAVPMTTGNTKSVSFVGSVGSYVATTNTANGVQFSTSGNKANAGNEIITLAATGTPIAEGTFNYTVNVNGATCTFSIIFTNALYSCGSLAASMPTVNLVPNTSYSGTVTIPYTNGNGLTYGSGTPLTSQGLTLTRVPGTYSSSGGTITYNLSGSYTGTTTNPSFVIPECGNTVIAGGAYINSPFSLYYAYGNYQVGVPMDANNYATGSVGISSSGYYSATSNTVNGVTFSRTPVIINTGYNFSLFLSASGTPLTDGTFTYTLTDNRGQTSTFDVDFYP